MISAATGVLIFSISNQERSNPCTNG
jgi:hypothetical protein